MKKLIVVVLVFIVLAAGCAASVVSSQISQNIGEAFCTSGWSLNTSVCLFRYYDSEFDIVCYKGGDGIECFQLGE